jgi:hypothetical protein
MEYMLKPRPDGSIKIVRKDDETAFIGFVYACGERLEVCAASPASEMMCDQIAAVNSIPDAISALEDHMASDPVNWKQAARSDCYNKFTPYGMLHVGRDCRGKWWAYRGGRPLHRSKTGKHTSRPVTFLSPAEAQEAAEKYVSNW